MNAPVGEKTFQAIRNNFSGTIILSNGMAPETGEAALNAGFADLVAFGRSFLSNPDFVEKIESGEPLNPADYAHLDTPGSVGYTDYPILKSSHKQKVLKNEIRPVLSSITIREVSLIHSVFRYHLC